MERKENQKKQINKKLIALIIGVVAIIIIVIAILLMVPEKKDNKKELEESLNKIGSNYYEDFYYQNIGSSEEQKAKILSQFSTIGIRIDLENLGVYNDGIQKEKIEKFKNSKSGEACNQRKTTVTIYPKSPYGKKDYTIEIDLNCGFEEK